MRPSPPEARPKLAGFDWGLNSTDNVAMGSASRQRILVLALGAGGLGFLWNIWDGTWAAGVVLVLVAALFVLMVRAGLNQIAQTEADAEEIKRRIASQRAHAALMDREDA